MFAKMLAAGAAMLGAIAASAAPAQQKVAAASQAAAAPTTVATHWKMWQVLAKNSAVLCDGSNYQYPGTMVWSFSLDGARLVAANSNNSRLEIKVPEDGAVDIEWTAPTRGVYRLVGNVKTRKFTVSRYAVGCFWDLVE